MHNFARLIFIVICIFSVQEFYAITSSVQDGNWTNSITWNNSGPACGDTIYISAGNTVIVNVHIDFSACGTPMFLIVEGILEFKNGPKLKLPCGSGVLVKDGGSVLGGGGKGSQNEIEICGIPVWIRSDGDLIAPVSFGEPFSEKIISIASGNWDVSSTWDCNCDPQFYHDAIIDTAHTVSAVAGIKFNDLFIYGTLDASALTGNITIFGNWNNSGSFLEGTTTARFIGDLPQQIYGNTNFYNLTLINANGVSITSGNIGLIKTLNLTLGNLATNNSLTLISNASGTANIAEIIGGSISGDIIMQRYIDAGATNWRFITSPISGTTIADLNDDFITSGFTGSDFPFWPTVANPWASIYYYDETQPGIQDSGFVAVTDVGNPIGVGEGMWVWSGDTITGTQPFTIDVQGPPNMGNINLPLSYTNSGFPADDGWNMVGNPYPSTLNWDDPSITKTGINNAIYIWNTNSQQFASYVGGLGTNGGSNYIASSQAFWLQTTSATANVQVTEASKTYADGSFLKQGSGVNPLTINVQNSAGTDQTIINFEENATINFDASFDALKMISVNPSLPNISTIMQNNNSIEYSINQLPEQEINILIKITTGVSGLHTINITGKNNFSNNSCLLLEDLFTGTIYDLNVTSSFTSFIYDTTSTPRFLLKFGAPKFILSADISCYGNPDGELKIEKNTVNNFDVVWKNSSGTIISSNTNVTGSDSVNNLNADTYTIETSDIICGSMIDTVVINDALQITSQFTSNKDTVYLSNGGNVIFTNLSNNANSYFWDFDDLNTSNLPSPSHQYSQVGNYVVTLDASQNINCYESISKTITVLNTATSINDINHLTATKIWVSNNKLFTKGNDIANIEIRNILGQLLFVSTSNNSEQIFNLEKISSQTLIVTIIKKNHISSTKVQYLKD